MKTTVGIPAYNEEKNIAKIIVESKKFADQIIVCDDGSKDSTATIAESLGAIVMQPDSIQDARLIRIDIDDRSSFNKAECTLITKR